MTTSVLTCCNSRRALLLCLQLLETPLLIRRCRHGNWKTTAMTAAFGFWDGIECNEDSGHVIKLDLTSSCLYGSFDFNSSLFDLVHLKWLSLADNDFNQSEILSTIIKLSKLSHLNLSSSGLVGQIPQDILNHTQLVSLDLSGVLISSSVPHVIANLSSLTHLSLERCGLQGVFAIETFRLPNLYSLNEASNQELRGYLPKFQESTETRNIELWIET